MNNETTDTEREIMEVVGSLTEEQQRKVLDFIEEIEKRSTPDDLKDEGQTEK